MKTLLIVGAGPEQLPAIQRARELGHRVVATDLNPEAPGLRVAHESRVVSTRDLAGNLAVAKAFEVDGVMTLASELGVPVVAAIAESLGLPGISRACAKACTDKNAMAEAFAAAGIPQALSRPIRSLAEAHAFVDSHGLPVVIKPSDASGQRGITRVEDTGALAMAVTAALEQASDGCALVERFVEGPEINISAVIENGQARILSLSHRITDPARAFGIAIKHLAPPPISPNQAEACESLAHAAIAAVGLDNGIAYPQLIVGVDGPVILEIAARIPGGHNREVAMSLSGEDMVTSAIAIALGEPVPAPSQPRFPATCVRFITALDGDQVSDLHGFEQQSEAPDVLLCYSRLSPGGAVPDLANSTARFGAIMTVGSTAKGVVDRAEEVFTALCP